MIAVRAHPRIVVLPFQAIIPIRLVSPCLFQMLLTEAKLFASGNYLISSSDMVGLSGNIGFEANF